LTYAVREQLIWPRMTPAHVNHFIYLTYICLLENNNNNNNNNIIIIIINIIIIIIIIIS